MGSHNGDNVTVLGPEHHIKPIMSPKLKLISAANRPAFERELKDFLSHRKKTKSLPETYTLKNILIKMQL